MKANEFIKKYGIEYAIKVVKNQPQKDGQMFRPYDNKYSTSFFGKKVVSVFFLKHLVESWELVEKHGGLFSAKCQIENECPDLEYGELEYYVDGEIFFTRVKDLDQAILDVESCQ